jgi:PKD repeat protein
VGGNDDACGLQSSVTAATTAGTQYFVYVTGFGTGTGAFTLSNDIAPTVPTVTAGGPIAICQGGSVTLTSSTANTYNWSPSGGTAQSATITTAGSYTVTVNDLNNCSATSTATVVTVNPAPTATLSGGGTACSGQTVDLTITTTGTGPWTVVMNDGSTNSTINVTSSPFTQAVGAAGNYSLVSVADASSCPGTVSGSATVTVTTSPTATISGGGQVCNGVGVDITGTFTGTGPWTVVLNDGLNDIPLPPIVTSPFTQNVTLPGTYTIVSVTDATSCPGTVSGSAIVTSGNGPTAAFTSAPTDLTVVFTDASTGSPTTWAWDFGDSNTSTQQNPTHTYTTAGTYNVCLTVTNNCGTNQICQSVTVTSASCTAAAGTISSSATACLVNGTATLTGTPGGNAVVPGGFATVYALSQGTNIVQVSATPTFTVTATGTYTLHTLVYNPADIDPTSVPLPVPVALVNGQLIQGGGTFCGSLDLVGATVTVVDAIVPTVTALGPVSFCQGGSVDIQSSTANSYSWTPSGNTQTITATATGTYSVTTVDANGCSATSNTIDVTVNSGPTADISGGGAICAGAGVDITGTLTGVGPWDVVVSTPGGPFPITGITASPYSQNVTVPGDYILISVSDASGCPGTVSGTATVTTGGNLPVASFTASANLLTVTFTDASTDATTYAWDFGDSGTSTSASPTHTYLADGTYNVCLTVTNSCGTDQFCQTVTVSSNACPVSAGTLNASAAPACLTPGQTVTLDATPSGNSIVPTGFQTLYLLVQGGIIQQTNTTPSFAVNSNGIYTIHTFVYDPNTFSTATIQNGVTTVASVNAQLLQGGGAICASLALSGVNFNVVTPVVPVVTPQGPTDICPGDAVLLTSSTASQYLWLPNQATASFTHASAPGDYTVTTVDANGCIATSAPVVVTNLPVTTGIITANGNTLTVDQVTTGYQWFHNGDPIPGANDQSYDAVESGYYWVIYTDPNGCETSSDTIEFSYIGIEEVGFDYISVYPNPSGGQFTVAVGEAKEELTFIVTELTGRVLFRQTIAQMGDIRQEISLDVASGTYLLQVLNNDGRGTSSLIQVMR